MLFADIFVIIDVFFKVTITYFLDDVVVMTTFHDIKHPDNVL